MVWCVRHSSSLKDGPTHPPNVWRMHKYGGQWNLLGDIQPNNGPLKHILKNLPKEQTQSQKQYFMPNTLRPKPHYLHLEDIFTLYPFPNTHINNHDHLPNLRRHIYIHIHIYIYIKYPPIGIPTPLLTLCLRNSYKLHPSPMWPTTC